MKFFVGSREHRWLLLREVVRLIFSRDIDLRAGLKIDQSLVAARVRPVCLQPDTPADGVGNVVDRQQRRTLNCGRSPASRDNCPVCCCQTRTLHRKSDRMPLISLWSVPNVPAKNSDCCSIRSTKKVRSRIGLLLQKSRSYDPFPVSGCRAAEQAARWRRRPTPRTKTAKT